MKLYQGEKRIQNDLKKRDTKRVESNKAAHQTEKAGSSTMVEDYQEVIAEILELKGYPTTLDISRYMDVSAPRMKKMFQRFDENGYLEY